MEFLQQIFNLVVVPLLGTAMVYLIALVKAKKISIYEKTDSELIKKYADMLEETIVDCVIATNQTYVNALKDKNAFTVEAQKEAFTKTYNAVAAILTEDAKEYLTSAVGDLQVYITNKIESTVAQMK